MSASKLKILRNEQYRWPRIMGWPDGGWLSTRMSGPCARSLLALASTISGSFALGPIRTGSMRAENRMCGSWNSASTSPRQ